MDDPENETAAGVTQGYRVEESVGFLLRRAYQRTTSIFNDVMGEFGVTPPQFVTLCKLADLGVASQNELGRQTAMDPATTWGVVARLVKRGWVTQSGDPNDGRLVILELTPKGRKFTAELRDKASQVSERSLAPLSTDEARHFLDCLRRIG